MLSTLMNILNNLMQGKIIINNSDLIAISNETERLLNIKDHTEYDVTIMNLIIQISNILYHNTDKKVLPLEDGVFDMLFECYKKYDQNYQVGAKPIYFDDSNNSESKDELITPMLIPDQDYIKEFLYLENINRNPSYGDYFSRVYALPHVYEDIEDLIPKKNINIPHKYPKLVGTLDKCKFVLDKQAIDRGVYEDNNVAIFERDFFAKHLQMGLINTTDEIVLVAELKYDGLSVEADVTDDIISARSRGDANADIAADLTPILKGFPFYYAPKIPEEESFGIKFEAILTYDNLEKLGMLRGKSYKNARNAVVGLFGSVDAAKYRDFITLVPLATSIEDIDRITEIEFMNKYYQNGVYLNYAILKGNYYEVLYQVYKFVEEAEYIRPYMSFMYDGVVISYINKDIINKLGRENSVNKYSVAIKFNPLKKEAIFTGYTFTIGQNGIITPMIHYTPVEFYGTIHTKSSGHSYARFQSLGLRIGEIINVEYTNDVMPYVTRSTVDANNELASHTIPVEFPKLCPSCGEPIFIMESGKSAICTNIHCHERQIARITNMFKKLNLKDFAEESLIAINVESLKGLAAVTLEEAVNALGQANGQKFIDRIVELNTTPIYDYKIVGSIGFSDIAIETWKKILNKIPLSLVVNLEYQDDKLYNTLVQIKGIGPNTANTIISERGLFYDDLIYILHMQNIMCSYGMTNKKSIRFTGIRDGELVAYLNSLGYDANGDAGVTKSTDILIVPTPGYTSVKTGKAGENTIIVDINEFKANMNKYLL